MFGALHFPVLYELPVNRACNIQIHSYVFHNIIGSNLLSVRFELFCCFLSLSKEILR